MLSSARHERNFHVKRLTLYSYVYASSEGRDCNKSLRFNRVSGCCCRNTDSEIRELEKLRKPWLHTVNVTQRGEESLGDINRRGIKFLCNHSLRFGTALMFESFLIVVTNGGITQVLVFLVGRLYRLRNV